MFNYESKMSKLIFATKYPKAQVVAGNGDVLMDAGDMRPCEESFDFLDNSQELQCVASVLIDPKSDVYTKMLLALATGEMSIWNEVYEYDMVASLRVCGVKLVDTFIVCQPNPYMAVLLEINIEKVYECLSPIYKDFPQNSWNINYYEMVLKYCLEKSDNPIHSMLSRGMADKQTLLGISTDVVFGL